MVFEARYLVSTHVWGRGQKYNTSTNLVLLVGAYWATSWLPNIGQVSYCCTSPSNTPKIQRNPHSSTDNPSCILKHFLTTMFTQSKMDGCTCLHMQRDIYIIYIYTHPYHHIISVYLCMFVCMYVEMDSSIFQQQGRWLMWPSLTRPGEPSTRSRPFCFPEEFWDHLGICSCGNFVGWVWYYSMYSMWICIYVYIYIYMYMYIYISIYKYICMYIYI